MNTRYTYAAYAKEVIAIVNGEIEVTDEVRARVAEKSAALLAAQEAKAAYNAIHPKKNTAKGASEATKEKANAIKGVLTATPMTAAEINAALGTDYTALQVANAVKYIEGAKASKVVRKTTNAKGLTAEKEYTAYSIG